MSDPLRDDLASRLEELNAIGIALSSERDIDRLLESILLAAKSITRADGGTLYMMDKEADQLRFAIVRTDSLGIAYGGPSGGPILFPPLPLHDADGTPNKHMVAVHAALTGQTVNIEDAYCVEGFDFSGTRKFDASTGYRSRSFLTVPLRNHEAEIIGVLQLLNAIDPQTGAVVPFTQSAQRLAESLASQAAVALTNRQLIDQLETLFEALIRMINLAIDEKSSHTGGHCERVPVLTMMIAEAVSDADYGPLADFHMDAKERYELNIAGLLHDCGKITTPVHVVDKATKLQTLFDRIALIDTRFEVLRRDARIALLEGLAAGGDPAQLEAEYQANLAALADEQALLRRSNRGSEAMSEADIARVREIAQRQWQHSEKGTLPFLDADEVENLTIRAGTLTAAEREIINHHIVTTIRMLEALPWPAHLRRVPEYAGGHHERMDGKGYPRGLTREQMSVPARMMGIADIFEALTAADRPYKQPMKLSLALEIMARFRDGGHIDPDIFEVFVRAGVYRAYGERFLQPEQLDEVDIERLLPSRH